MQMYYKISQLYYTAYLQMYMIRVMSVKYDIKTSH